jgi:membrane protease YdiL (CAAX protease family)
MTDATKHPYDLPAQFPLRVAVIIVILYMFTPFWPPVLIAPVIGAGSIVYYAIQSNGRNQLGMSLSISSKAKRYIRVIVVTTAAVLLSWCIFITIVKHLAIHDPEFTEFPVEQVPYEWPKGWGAGDELGDALFHKNLIGVIRDVSLPILWVVILGPLLETVVFIGMLFPVIWRDYGYRRAIIIVPLLFAVLHIFQQQPYIMVLTFVNGYIQALLYARTKSIYPSIVLHACWNLTVVSIVTIFNWGLPSPID